MTTANKETNMMARMGCSELHFETRFTNPIPLDSEDEAGLKVLVWSNFIRP